MNSPQFDAFVCVMFYELWYAGFPDFIDGASLGNPGAEDHVGVQPL